MKRIQSGILIGAVVLLISSCNDFLNVKPQGEDLSEESLSHPDSFQRVLAGIYDVAANSFNGRYQFMAELLGPNLAKPNKNDDLNEIWIRRSNFFNGTINTWFTDMNRVVYRANFMNDYFDGVSFDPGEKERIQAEADFLKCLSFFGQLQLFAQPYGYTSDNSHMGIPLRKVASADPTPRSTVKECYDYLLTTLTSAIDHLPDDNDVYADKNACRALLAKIYMQMSDYEKAAEMANAVIETKRYTLGTEVNRFSSTLNGETIFGFYSTSAADNRGSSFVDNYRSDNKQPTLSMSKEFYEMVKSDTTDKRAALFTIQNAGQENEVYVTTKHNEDYQSVPVLHLTDMMLLRAECYALLGKNLDVAVSDINAIRDRAYTNPTNLSSGAAPGDIRDAARYERRIEMQGEGDWVFHLKRRGAEGENITSRNAPWNCPGMVLQFPVSERSQVFEMNPEGGCE